MSTAPSPYERQANFTSFEQANPTSPKPGSSLDAEFNAIRTLANALLSRLAEIQRDDGRLANGVVRPDSLSTDTLTLIGSDIVPRGDWTTDTVYDVRDLVSQGGVTYVCLVEHMSGTFATDLAAGKWQGMSSSADAADIPFTPAGGLASTDVQAAIVEVAALLSGYQPLAAALTALSAAGTPVLGGMYYGTGLGAASQLVSTTDGRALLTAANFAAVRTLLSLGTAALVNTGATNGLIPLVGAGDKLAAALIPEITATMLAATLDLSSKTVTLPAANTPVFTKSYSSSNQTITAGGALTLPHSLGAAPKLVQARLVCITGELGYSSGDEVIINPGASYVSSSTGLSLVLDATNVVVRFGSSGGALSVVRKDTGALAIITAANWRLVIRAWA